MVFKLLTSNGWKLSWNRRLSIPSRGPVPSSRWGPCPPSSLGEALLPYTLRHPKEKNSAGSKVLLIPVDNLAANLCFNYKLITAGKIPQQDIFSVQSTDFLRLSSTASIKGCIVFLPSFPSWKSRTGKGGGKLNSSTFSASKKLLFTLGPTRQHLKMNRPAGSRPWSIPGSRQRFFMHPGKWGTRGANARHLPFSVHSSIPDSQLCPGQTWPQEAKRREHRSSHNQELGTKCANLKTRASFPTQGKEGPSSGETETLQRKDLQVAARIS